MVIEARTTAEQLLYQVDRFVEKNREHLTDAEISLTAAKRQRVADVLTTGNKDTILKAVDDLEEPPAPLPSASWISPLSKP
jgi:molecular chaperone HscA